ncbi:MAG: pyrroline-5-carboxylate reductase [Candidatus Omnitrophota bacterium]
MKKTIGIIGFGNMGSAIAEHLKTKYPVSIFDKDEGKVKNLFGLTLSASALDLVKRSDVVIMAVKPQDLNALLEEVRDYTEKKLFISIAAGISTSRIEKYLRQAAVIRVMPNIGVKIGEAESSLCKGRYATEEDLSFVRELFDYLGKTWVMAEDMIDAATAISGSGPAYIYYDMEVNKIDPLYVPEELEREYIRRLTEAAKGVGFDAQTAAELAISTTASSLSLSASTRIAPVELRKQITSKGGTTEAALKVLDNNGSWTDAALAAQKRAKELSRG